VRHLALVMRFLRRTGISSEPLLTVSGIQPRVPRRTLSRRPALLRLTAAMLRFIASVPPIAG
jgi:hypothetical protein